MRASPKDIETKLDRIEIDSQRTEVEKRLIEGVNVMSALATELTDYVKRNREGLNSKLYAFDKTEELMAEQIHMLKQISESMQILVKASAETNAAINENTARLNALLTKVDSYFGGETGLKYKN